MVGESGNLDVIQKKAISAIDIKPTLELLPFLWKKKLK
jgi:hypothetical protein